MRCHHQAIDGGVGAVVVTLLLVAVTISIQLVPAGGRNVRLPTTVPALYVFGDSLLDVGNNNHLPGADVPQGQRALLRRRLPRRRETHRPLEQRLQRRRLDSQGYGIREEPAGVPVADAALQPSRRQGDRRSELCLWRSWDSRLHCAQLRHHQGSDGSQPGLHHGERPSVQIPVPRRHRHQRHGRVRRHAPADRRGRLLLEPHLQLLGCHHGAVRDGREEVWRDQHRADRVRAAPASAEPHRRVRRRSERARRRLRRRAQVPLGQRAPARPARPRLLARRPVRPDAGDHSRPAGCPTWTPRAAAAAGWAPRAAASSPTRRCAPTAGATSSGTTATPPSAVPSSSRPPSTTDRSASPCRST
ncbi:hypothetical protein PVAP13_4NG329500 [Panicum virgatum]|uniref:GDSL esterase/lipase n=1 Tax=Panicum virgatum TaxID=38727 RepID=A0A8T0TIP6_PANVG|nr:hypothetical protein PVAP13_4NG329500 [Panicum virgatum]